LAGIQYVVIPEGLLLATGEQPGYGRNAKPELIDREGLWFQGTDGRTEYVSVKVDRTGLNKLLALEKQP
jgi:hypothetical protein